MSEPIPARLLEAREFLGLGRDECAQALGIPAMLLDNYEHGHCLPDGRDLRRLSRLYARPVAWLCGQSDWQPDSSILEALDRHPGLTQHDRDAVLDFAEWLAEAGPAPQRRTA